MKSSIDCTIFIASLLFIEIEICYANEHMNCISNQV